MGAVIDLKKCIEQPLAVDERFDVSSCFADHPDIETIDRVAVKLEVRHAGSGRFLVTGRLGAAATAYCVRCLESFPVDLSAAFQLTYLPEASRVAPAGDTEMHRDEIDVCYYRDDELALLPLLEEQLNLSLPMRFLCLEECRGLCQHCGANRNQQDCGCGSASVGLGVEAVKVLRR